MRLHLDGRFASISAEKSFGLSGWRLRRRRSALPPSESQPLARFDRVALDGRRSSLVLGSKPQRAQSPIEGDLLEGVGQGLDLVAVVDRHRPLEQPLEHLSFGGVLERTKRSAPGVGEPALGVAGALPGQPTERRGSRRGWPRKGHAGAWGWWEEPRRPVRDEDEHRARGRLLKA